MKYTIHQVAPNGNPPLPPPPYSTHPEPGAARVHFITPTRQEQHPQHPGHKPPRMRGGAGDIEELDAAAADRVAAAILLPAEIPGAGVPAAVAVPLAAVPPVTIVAAAPPDEAAAPTGNGENCGGGGSDDIGRGNRERRSSWTRGRQRPKKAGIWMNSVTGQCGVYKGEKYIAI